MNWWHYLLLVNFYLVLFFGFYALLLRRETFFQLNRVYLVASSLLSLFIPLIQVDWVKNLFITQEVQNTIYSVPMVEVYNFTVRPQVSTAITLGQLINAAYIAVTVFLVLRLLWQLLVLKKEIEKPSPSAAYSFFKKISLGDNASQSKIIAEHEQVHAGQWHSVDVMIIELVMIINWFNPVVYLYRFAIKYIHEFIADRQVIQAGTDKADYALLLLSQTFEVDSHNLVTPFFNRSLLKQRIMMMQKDKSHRIALAKYGLSAPLFILMMIFSSATVSNSKTVKAINKKTENVLAMPADNVVDAVTDHAEIPATNPSETITDTTKKIYLQVDKQPEFPGGIQSFGRFLGTNIHYPATDREAKVQGTVIATFVVETNGALSDITAVRGPSAAMKKEAVRVLALSPKWKPGYQNKHTVRVQYTVPIKFTLDDVKPAANDKDKIHATVDKQPVFPGGFEAFGQFLGRNIKYPATDREKGLSGRVICTFVVERSGTLSDIKALKGPSQAMMDESVRVLKLSPKWSPGLQDKKPVRVQYTVPISFTIGPADEKPVTGAVRDTSEKNANVNPGSVLYVIDGHELELGSTPLATIPQENIASMEVLKGETAAKLYGDKGKNGVIMITTVKKNGDALKEVMANNAPPMFFVDDKEIKIKSSKEALAAVPQEKIALMEVFKGTEAVKLYGDKGKNGVIKITTKK